MYYKHITRLLDAINNARYDRHYYNYYAKRLEYPQRDPYDYKTVHPQTDLVNWEFELLEQLEWLADAAEELENWERDLNEREENIDQSLDELREELEDKIRKANERLNELNTSPDEKMVELRQLIAREEQRKTEALKMQMAANKVIDEAADKLELANKKYSDACISAQKITVAAENQIRDEKMRLLQHRETSDNMRATYNGLLRELEERERIIKEREKALEIGRQPGVVFGDVSPRAIEI